MGSDKQIRLKFKPRYREEAVVKPERIDEPEIPASSSSTSAPPSSIDIVKNENGTNEEGDKMIVEKEEDEVVFEGEGGFSLVNY